MAIYLKDLPLHVKLLQLHHRVYEPPKEYPLLYGIVDIEVINPPPYNLQDYKNTEIVLATVYTSINDDYRSFFLAKTIHDDDIEVPDKTEICHSEEEVLSKVMSYIYDVGQIDILTGWNVLFDVRYLIARMYVRRMQYLLDRFFTITNIGNSLDSITFKSKRFLVLDYMMDLIKNTSFHTTSYSNYKLDTVAKHELGEEKLFKITSLDDFNLKYKEDPKTFIEYNQIDVMLVKKLEDKFRYLQHFWNLGKFGHLPSDYMIKKTKMLSGFVTWYALSKDKVCRVDKEIYLANNTQLNARQRISGGYVREPKRGLFTHILTVDVTSQYPHILVDFNLSPETVIMQIEEDHITEAILNNGYDRLLTENPTFQVTMYDKERFGHKEPKTLTFKEFDSILKDVDWCITASGLVLDNSSLGIVANLEHDLIIERVRYKKLMKQEKDPKLKFEYNNEQYKRKIAMNSLFGVYDTPGFIAYDKNISAAITTTGRALIKYTARLVSKYLQGKPLDDIPIDAQMDSEDLPYILYGDTDSIFISVGRELSDDEINDILDVIHKYVKEDFLKRCRIHSPKLPIQFEAERYKKMLPITKKRYILQKLDGSFVYKGIEIVRTDFPELSRQILKDLIQLLFSQDKIDKMVVANFIKEAQQRVGEYISKGHISIARPITVMSKEQYKSTPVHIIGAELWNKLNPNLPILPMQKCYLWYLKGYYDDQGRFHEAKYLATPPDIEYLDTNRFMIDVDRTIDMVLFNRLQHILDALGYNVYELINLAHGIDLFDIW